MKKIYGLPGCCNCKEAVKECIANNEEYQYIDLSKDKEAMRRLRKLKISDLPFIEEV